MLIKFSNKIQMVNEHGWDWKNEVENTWAHEMDYLFNETRDVTTTTGWLYFDEDDWCISPEMVKTPLEDI